MSLVYVIDAYNLTNHALFKPKTKSDHNLPGNTLSFIVSKKPSLAKKNKIILVFDGYCRREWQVCDSQNIMIIFSRKASADEKIKKIVEDSPDRKNIIVVSCDKELSFIVRSLGAACQPVEEFLGVKKISNRNQRNSDGAEELSYSDKHKINEELKKLWLS